MTYFLAVKGFIPSNLDDSVDYPAQWPLTEATGAARVSYGGISLADNNTVTQVAGKVYPFAAHFTAASSQSLSIASQAALASGDIDFSVYAWFKLDSLPSGGWRIVSKVDGSIPGAEWTLGGDATTMYFSLDQEDINASAPTITAPSIGVWHFVVAWYDSVNNAVRIQLDGGGTTSVLSWSPGPGIRSGAQFVVGGEHFGVGTRRFFDGSIGPVGFVKKVLSSTERAFLYNGGLGTQIPMGIPGTLTKEVDKVLIGSAGTPTGVLTKQDNKVLIGSAGTPIGSLSKQQSVRFNGDIIEDLPFTHGFYGDLTKQVNKVLAGSAGTPVGALIRQVNKILSGGLTPDGALSNVQTVGGITLTGGLTPTGALTKEVDKILIGSAGTPTGVLTKQANKRLLGTLLAPIVTRSAITHGSDTANATSYVTTSVTPTANKLQLLAVVSQKSGGAGLAPTVTGCGLTWVNINDTSDGNVRTSLFRAMGASPTTGALTISFGAVTQLDCIWDWNEFGNVDQSGTDGSGAIAQSAVNSANTTTSLVVTLGSFSNPNNATYGVAGRLQNSFGTQGSGFSLIFTTGLSDGATDSSIITEWKISSDTTVDFSWASGSVSMAAVAVEIVVNTTPTGITGTLTKEVDKVLVGDLGTPTGALAATKVGMVTLSGALGAPVGALIKQVGKVLSGVATPTGTVDTLLAASESGSLTPTGSLTKQVQKSFEGSLGAGIGYAAVILADTPLGYWRCGEVPGSALAVDISGNGFDLDYDVGFSNDPFGAAGALVGDPDTGFHFDGTNYLHRNNSAFGLVGNVDNAIEMWVNPTGSTDQLLFSYGESGTGRVISLAMSIGHWFVIHYSIDHDFAVNTGTGTWHHVVISYNAATGDDTLYVDGVSAAVWNHAPLDLIDNKKCYFGLGSWNDGFHSSAYQDEIALYAHQLSPAQVAAHYDAGTHATPAGMNGRLIKQVNKILAGALGAPTGTLLRDLTYVVSGSLTPVGTLVKQVQKAFTGSLGAPTGAVVNVLSTEGTLNLTGDMTPSGSLTKQVQKTFLGTVAPTASVELQIQKLFAGGVNPTADLLKQAQKNLSGATVPGGTVIFMPAKSFSGGETPTGGLTKQVNKGTSGSVGSSGTLAETLTKGLSGVVAPVGVLNRQIQKPLSGAVSSIVGVLTKQVGKIVNGAFTPTGALSTDKVTIVAFTGSITPTGSFSKQVQKTLSGSVVPVGSIIKQVQKLLVGGVTPVGALTKQVRKFFDGGITPTGTLTTMRVRVVSLDGTITPTGTLVRLVGKNVSGVVGLVGTLTKQVSKFMSGGVTPTGTVEFLRAVDFSGEVDFTGDLEAGSAKTISLHGSITPTGSLTKQISKQLAGSLAPFGSITLHPFRANPIWGFLHIPIIGGVIRERIIPMIRRELIAATILLEQVSAGALQIVGRIAGMPIGDFTLRDVPRGDTCVFDISLNRIDPVTGNETLDLLEAGTHLWFTGKQTRLDADDDAVFQKTELDGIEILDSNHIRVILQPEDTETLPADVETLHYDVQVVEGVTAKKTTPINDILVFEADVTRA